MAKTEITQEDIAILKALKELGGEAACKEIAEKAGLNPRSVAAKMRKLKNRGLVEPLGKGKYKLTPEGEKLAA